METLVAVVQTILGSVALAFVVASIVCLGCCLLAAGMQMPKKPRLLAHYDGQYFYKL